MNTEVIEKECITCNCVKKVDNFSYRNDTNTYRNQCKQCVYDKKLTWRKKNIKKVRGYTRKSASKLYYQNRDDMLLRAKEYREANHEKVILSQKRWRSRNPDKLKKSQKTWRKNNPGKSKEASARWAKRYPEKKAECNRKRRAKKHSVGEDYTSEERTITLYIFQNKCFRCNSDENLTLDHHFPLSGGNALTINNCVLLCKSCNSSKGTKLPYDFYTEKELLRLDKILSAGYKLCRKKS